MLRSGHLFATSDESGVKMRVGLKLWHVCWVCLFLLGWSVPASAQWTFVRGDLDGDGEVLINDPIFVFNYLFVEGPIPPCFDSADANDDGTINIADGLYIINYLFLFMSPPPAAPFPTCGTDPTNDLLNCLGPLDACPAFQQV